MKRKALNYLVIVIWLFLFPVYIHAAELSLVPHTSTLKVGQSYVVDIVLSGGEETLGTDVILTFDPKKFTATEVKTTKLYPTFNPPAKQRIIEKEGKILVSGSGGLNQPVLAKGTLATVTFVAKGSGTTTVAFDYAPGATSKTGVISFKGDDLLTSPPKAITFTIQKANIFEIILQFFSRLFRLKSS